MALHMPPLLGIIQCYHYCKPNNASTCFCCPVGYICFFSSLAEFLLCLSLITPAAPNKGLLLRSIFLHLEWRFRKDVDSQNGANRESRLWRDILPADCSVVGLKKI